MTPNEILGAMERDGVMHRYRDEDWLHEVQALLLQAQKHLEEDAPPRTHHLWEEKG